MDRTDPARDQPRFTRLSASPLWARQRDYFEAQGPHAWATGTVPHYVTCNPFLARAYAEVVCGFAADCARAAPAPDGQRTLYLIELGAGSGRLGYHVVRALAAAGDAAAHGWRLVYVMTDVAERTVAWWQDHPRLAPLADAGLLDFARFDATGDDTLTLRRSGRTLSPDAPADQLVVLANYLFDSLPHDVFESHRGTIYDCLCASDITVASDGGEIAHVDLVWAGGPPAPSPYGDPVHDALVASHAGADGFFAFPRAALVGLDRLRALGRGPLLVLSADKGASTLDEVVTTAPPTVVSHGSVSMTVNYHALGGWAQAHGGTWLAPEHGHRTLEVCGLVLGLDDQRATLAGFERAIACRSPDDFHALKRVLVARAGELRLAELLAYLRLSGHDAKLFLDLAPAIRAAVPGADLRTRADLLTAVARVWDGYLPIGEATDLAGVLAELAADLGAWRDAVALCDASLALHGDQPERRRLRRACWRAAHDPTAARRLRHARRPTRAPADDPFAVAAGCAPGMVIGEPVA